jgi:phosphoglycolate phosphatase
LRTRNRAVLGIATGKSRKGVMHLFDRHGFHGWFATVQTSDTNPSKPHPQMVLEALAETGAEPHEAIVIGDTSYDIEMARAAGVGAIGVTWGNHPPGELEHAGAHHIINEFSELDEQLERLWEAMAR